MPIGNGKNYRPKYPVREYGENGLISMTDKQYQHLLTLVDKDVLSDYISRLEDYIMGSNTDSYRHTLRPSAIIKKWIKEDFSLRPEN